MDDDELTAFAEGLGIPVQDDWPRTRIMTRLVSVAVEIREGEAI